MASEAADRGRIEAIDLARGIALIAMAAYHALWDASYLGLIDIGIGISPFWVTVQRAILTAFLLLAGVSLILAHGEGIRWQRFWRRWLMVAAGALAVSAGTYLLLPDYVAYFGVLHAIALFSLIGLAFLRAPLWLLVLAAALVFAIAFYGNPLFNTRALSWIGFFTTTPPTTDLVPVFPWLGVVLLGMAAVRRGAPLLARLSQGHFADPLSRLLRLLGRWSLLFYLLHQPVIWGATYAISALQPDPIVARAAEFTQSCTATCEAEAKFCAAYCQCALEVATRDDLWFAISADPRTNEQQQSVNQMVGLCTAMADNSQ